MSLATAGTALRDFIINNVSGFEIDTCKWIDESVFDYIQTQANAPEFCVIVDYGGLRPNQSAREFRSLTIGWSLFINYYHAIPVDGDYINAYNAGIAFIDTMMIQLAQNSTLDSAVMGATPTGGGPPVVYQRANHWYILFDIEVQVVDNIS